MRERIGMISRHTAVAALLCFVGIGAGCAEEGPLLPVTPDEPITVEHREEQPKTPAPFSLVEISPAQGSTAGFTQVELRGGALLGVKRVLFGGSDALEFMAVNDELIVAHTPVRPHGSVDVEIVHENGERRTLVSAYRFIDDVQVGSVNPKESHLFGGEAVTILGNGFSEDSVVLIGEKKALGINVLDSSTIVAVVPEGDSAGPVDVLVSSSAGTGILRDGLAYVTAPSIALVTPPASPVGTEVMVDLQGEGFYAPLLLTVDGKEVSDVTVHEASHLTVTVPARAEAGSVDVAVVTSFGTTIAKNGLTFYGPEDKGLLALYPATGALQGGDLVTLSFSGVEPNKDTTIYFGGQKAERVATDWEAHYFLVRTPPADESGSVDVTLQLGEESHTLEAAFEYVRRPRIVEVEPNFGSSEGGDRIKLLGHGFSPKMSVRVGALAATHLTFIDVSTVEITTPYGAPGLANVTVIEEGHINTLQGGFLFQGDAAIWALSPPTGSIAGGTHVTLYGNGLEHATAVLFDGKEALIVEQSSPTKLVLKTPPAEAGAVSVTVETGDGTIRRDRAFSYYDPSSDGGLWGGKIEGNINVTVFDLWYRGRIEGATVLLGDSAESPHVGTTDANGQITFGADDLKGTQLLTAVKEGYQIGSLVSLDAKNVAIGLEPVPTCEMIEDMPCGEGGGNEGAKTDAKVNHLFKGVKTPWGDCDGHEGLEGDLCAPCDSDADCSHGQCTAIPEKGSFCTYDCEQPSDCPDGFLCLPVPEEINFQCVPSAGEYKTYCDITLSSMDAEDPIAFPGIPVDDLGNLELATRLGDYAIFCWSGMLKNGKFTPEVLGVARGLHSTEEGATVNAAIDMKYPLKQDVEIVLDRPAIGPSEEEETTYVRIALNLGPEGILDFPLLQAKGRGALTTKLPATLAGDLYNATYTLVARAKSSFEPTAESITIASEVSDIRNDRAWKLTGNTWNATKLSSDNVNAMVAHDGVVYAVGENGFLVRSFGGAWAHSGTSSDADLRAITFAGTQPVAAGDRGALLRFDGVTWKNAPSPTSADIVGLSGLDSGKLFAVAGNTLFSSNGETWSLASQAPSPLKGVLAQSAQSVWVVGEDGFIGHFNGVTLSTLSKDKHPHLNALWEAPDGTLIIAGDRGTLLKIMDGKVQALPSGVTSHLLAIGGDEARFWAVGEKTTILEVTEAGIKNVSPEGTGSTLQAIAGMADDWWTLGHHELVLGPMMAIPEQVDIRLDESGSAITSWKTQGGEDSHFNLITAGSMVGPCEACGMMFMLPYREWRATIAGGIEGARIPNLYNLIGRAHFNPGNKTVNVTRVYVDSPFDFNSNQGNEFIGAGWRSWSTSEISIAPPIP
jgi:hypothetical protein